MAPQNLAKGDIVNQYIGIWYYATLIMTLLIVLCICCNFLQLVFTKPVMSFIGIIKNVFLQHINLNRLVFATMENTSTSNGPNLYKL